MPLFRNTSSPGANDQGIEHARTLPADAFRPLTAAAQLMRLDDKGEAEKFRLRRNSNTTAWQADAWEYYDAIGEIKYALNLVAAVVSRIRLYAGAVNNASEAPTIARNSEHVSPELALAAERALARLDTSFGGTAGLLKDAALNLSVTGEALDVDTPIPTPYGFTTMGALRDGDTVYGGDGTPVRVLKAHPVRTDRNTYELTFNTPGNTIVADEDHLWEVYQVKDRRWAAEAGHEVQPVVLRTKEMAEHVRHYGQTNYVIKREAVTGGDDSGVTIDPYVLGYWLGDGWPSQGAITAHPDDQPSLHANLAQAGYRYKVRASGGGYQTGVYGLKAELRTLNVLNNKHIPEAYLRGTYGTRLALLQGLIDSDGHVKNGSVEFSNKNRELLQSVVHIASSLGFRVGKIRDRKDGTARLGFRTEGKPVARLPRKAAQVGTPSVRDGFDYIKSITPTPSRAVRCITVDSEDQTFLAGDRYVRTHNCYLVQIPERRIGGQLVPESWDIRSVDELQVDQQGNYSIAPRADLATAGGQLKPGVIPLPKGAFLGRIWRAHPRFSDEPDSSLKGLLDLCAELLLLNRTFRAIERSRLNAGLLYIPDGMAVSAGPDPDFPSDGMTDEDTGFSVPTPEELEDEFEDQLMDAMTTPIADESSAAAIVPLLVRGPAELGEKIQHIKFERAYDDALIQRAERVLERILQGLDVPKDTVTGLANVKYCLSADTEILTTQGWKTYDKLTLNDTVRTLNRETGQAEWQHPTAVNVFEVDESDPLLSIESESHSSLSTMNHGWHVRRQTTANGAAAYDWIDTTSADLTERTNVWIPTAAPSQDTPTVKKHTDEFVELVAWWTTEGHYRPGAEHVNEACTDRTAWTKLLTDRRKALGLSRRAVVQRMGKHVENSNAANSHMIHIEKAGGVTLAERTRLASALDLPEDVLHGHFTRTTGPALGVIAQSLRVNPDYVDRIRAVLTRMCEGHGASNGLNRGRIGDSWFSESLEGRNGVVYFTLSDTLVQKIQSVCPGADKVVDPSFVTELTEDQLRLFLDTVIAGDGWEREDGRRSITQKVSERLDAIEMAAILLGESVIRRTGVSRGYKPDTMYELTIKSRKSVAIASTTRKVTHLSSGIVWCPTTPNGSWLARRNGKVFYTLNSNAVQIDESLYKAHIEPLLLLISDALTTVYLRPYLKSIGFSEEEVKQVVVWYDPSAVATRNDRAADADSGYDKMAISVDTWRRAHGFSDADAPTPTELALRLLQSRASFTPEITEALLGAVAPEIMQAAREASQATSAAPVPDNVQQILDGGQPTAAPAAEPTDNAGLAEPAGTGNTPPVEPASPTGEPVSDAAKQVAPDVAPIPLAEPSE